MKGDSTRYLRSLAAAAMSQSHQVRDLIGDRHWLSDGRHKEALLSAIVSRHAPAGTIVCAGFVLHLPTTPYAVGSKISSFWTRLRRGRLRKRKLKHAKDSPRPESSDTASGRRFFATSRGGPPLPVASWPTRSVVGHLAFAPSLTAKMVGDFQPRAGALDCEFPLHFSQARSLERKNSY
jgi:hypothetical protein